MKLRRLFLLTSIATVVCTPSAFAAGTDMPWEAPLQNILDSIQGPVANRSPLSSLSSPA